MLFTMHQSVYNHIIYGSTLKKEKWGLDQDLSLIDNIQSFQSEKYIKVTAVSHLIITS